MTQLTPWERLQSEPLISNPYLTLRRDTCRLPDGQIIDDYYVLVERDVACVVALTPARELLLVEQYKHGLGRICLEIPGGVFASDAADPLAEARREFNEETGYDAPAFFHVGTLPVSPARTTIRMHLYAALDAVPCGTQQLDSTEKIIVHRLPVDTVLDLIRSGAIDVSTTVSGIFLGLDYLRRAGLLS